MLELLIPIAVELIVAAAAALAAIPMIKKEL